MRARSRCPSDAHGGHDAVRVACARQGCRAQRTSGMLYEGRDARARGSRDGIDLA